MTAKAAKPQYRHLIAGAIGDVPHQPGDPVDPKTAERKLAEWLAAGIIEQEERSGRTGRQDQEPADAGG